MSDVARESPCPAVGWQSRVLSDVQYESLIGVLGNLKSRVWGCTSRSERGDGGGVLAAIVEDTLGGDEIITSLVCQDTESGDDLIDTSVGNTDDVVSWSLIELHHERDTVAVGEGELVNNLGLNVVTVELIDVQFVVVDGDVEDGKAGRADERESSPAVLGIHLLSEVLAGEGCADVVGSRWECCQIARELRSLNDGVAGGNTALRSQRSSIQDLRYLRCCVGSEEINTRAKLRSKAVQGDGVGASPVNVGRLLNRKELVEGETVPVGSEDRGNLVSGSLDLFGITNQAKWSVGIISGRDDNSSEETIHHLSLVVSVVEVCSRSIGNPCICPGCTRLDDSLGDTGYTVGPWGFELSDTVEMDARYGRAVVDDGEVDDVADLEV